VVRDVDFQEDPVLILEDVPGTVVNFGIHYEISEVVKIIALMGTGVIANNEYLKTDFISFSGFQFNI
jgi:hypothetical protein